MHHPLWENRNTDIPKPFFTSLYMKNKQTFHYFTVSYIKRMTSESCSFFHVSFCRSARIRVLGRHKSILTYIEMAIPCIHDIQLRSRLRSSRKALHQWSLRSRAPRWPNTVWRQHVTLLEVNWRTAPSRSWGKTEMVDRILKYENINIANFHYFCFKLPLNV